MPNKSIKYLIPLILLLISCSSDSSIISSLTTSSSSSSITNDLDLSIYNSTPLEDELNVYGYRPIYKDSTFRGGFEVSKCKYNQGESPHHDEILQVYEDSVCKQYWGIAQWNSRFDIYDNNGMRINHSKDGLIHEITSNGIVKDGILYPGKKIRFNTKTGEHYLELNGYAEYDELRKNPDVPWAHLLFGQSWEQDELINLSSCQDVIIATDFAVTKCDDMNPNNHEDFHAVQFVFYITLQNRRIGSKDFGKYIWFGIPLFDNRYQNQETKLWYAIDKGTNSYMYKPSSIDVMTFNDGQCPSVNEKTMIRYNAKEAMINAVNTIIEIANWEDTKLEDIYFGSTNYGFENGGMYNIGVEIEDFGVFYR